MGDGGSRTSVEGRSHSPARRSSLRSERSRAQRQLGRMPPRTMPSISRATPGPVRDALDNPSRGRGAAAAQEAALFYQWWRNTKHDEHGLCHSDVISGT